MAKKKVPRTNTNPAAELSEFAAANGLQQYMIKLCRRSRVNGQLQNLEWQYVSPESIQMLEQNVMSKWGGGNYEAYFYHPAGGEDAYQCYTFSNSGPEIQPEQYQQPQQQGGQPMWNPMTGGWVMPQQPNQPQAQATPMVHPMTGAPMIQPMMPMMPWGMNPMGGYGMPPYPLYPQQSLGASSGADSLLRAELDNLKSTLHQRDIQLEQERARADADRREQNLLAQIRDIKDGTDKMIRELADKISQGSGKASELEPVFNMVRDVQTQTSNVLNRMAEREIEKGKSEIERERIRAESEINYRRESIKLIEGMQDPSKHMQMMMNMGELTANQLNLISQLAQSGLLEKAGEDAPPWLQTINQGLEAFQGFVKDYFGQSQRATQQMQQGLAGMPVPPHIMGPGQMPPQVTFPQGPGMPAQHISQMHTPVQTFQAVGSGPSGQTPQPTGQSQQQVVSPEAMQFVPVAQIPEFEVEVPEQEKDKLQAIGKSLLMKEEYWLPAEMMYNVADAMRYWWKLRGTPKGWENVFTDPKAVIVNLIRGYDKSIQIPDEYLDDICRRFMEFEGEFQQEQADNSAEEQGQPDRPTAQQPPQQPGPMLMMTDPMTGQPVAVPPEMMQQMMAQPMMAQPMMPPGVMGPMPGMMPQSAMGPMGPMGPVGPGMPAQPPFPVIQQPAGQPGGLFDIQTGQPIAQPAVPPSQGATEQQGAGPEQSIEQGGEDDGGNGQGVPEVIESPAPAPKKGKGKNKGDGAEATAE